MRTKVNWWAVMGWMYVVMVWAVILFLAVMLLTGCASPKIIEQHHHYSKEVDTLAVESMVDARISSWHDEMMTNLHQMMEQTTSEQTANEEARERITETVTTYVDSLGRTVSQQQRTTERNLSRQWQQREEQMKTELREELRRAISRHDSIWQQRMEAMQAHWEQSDSTSVSQQPAAEDNRPWYKRWGEAFVLIFFGVATAIIAWLIFKIGKIKI